MANFINKDELNIDTYPIFCKMYLVQQINDVIQPSMTITYSDVNKLINIIDEELFLNLNNNSGVLLLSNKIYQLFMCVNVNIDRQFLYNCALHLSQYCKIEYNKSRYEYEWKNE